AYNLETKCGLSHYLTLYQKQRAKLLKWHSRLATDHPESVATTWLLSFKRVEQANKAAGELLKISSFLHADDILEEIFTEGAPELGPILHPIAADAMALDEAIGELLRYSLVKRDTDKQTISIHRLVQMVIKDDMKRKVQRMWAERVVKAITHGSVIFRAVEEIASQADHKWPVKRLTSL